MFGINSFHNYINLLYNVSVVRSSCAQGCVSTGFYSWSLRIGENALRQLSTPSTDKLCQGSKKKLESCLEHANKLDVKGVTTGEAIILDANSDQCQSFRDTLNKCQNAVLTAYQQANLGGCVEEVASLSVCTVECGEEDNGSGLSEECLDRCQKNNGLKSVNECIVGLIQRNFRDAGIQNRI